MQVGRDARALPRSASAVGTFDERAFQLCDDRGAGADTELHVKLFDVFGYPCVPLIGTYAESYEPTIPVVLLQQSRPLGAHNVPPSVHAALAGRTVQSVFVHVHGCVPRMPCSHFTCDSSSHVSLVMHTWFYPDVSLFTPDLALNKRIRVGIFEPRNVRETHQNIQRDELGSGAPFGATGPRECSIHGPAFSPNNNQIDRVLTGGADYCSFWVVSWSEAGDAAAVVSYHAIAANADCEDSFGAIAASAPTLGALIDGFATSGYGELAQTIARVFGATQ